MQRVLVTGAKGFIGRYAAREYAKTCYVIGIGHGHWDKNEYQNWGLFEWHEADVTMESLQDYAQQIDTIIHCAGSGSVGFSIENPMIDFERTVWTTHYILEYIRLYSPKTKLIYLSSAAVYGNAQNMPIDENTPLEPISPYGVHKKIVEELCRMYNRTYGVKILIARLFSVYGDGLCKQLLWDACSKLSQGQNLFWGTGKESRDFVHVTDVAKALVMMNSKVKNDLQIVNVASGKAVPIIELLSELFNAYGAIDKPCFGGQINEGNPMHYWADIKRLKTWGWYPEKNLSDGIAEYVRWFKQNA